VCGEVKGGDPAATVSSSNWGPCIVIYGAVPYAAPRFAVQHLADNLARYAPVLYVDPPLSQVELAREPRLRPFLDGPRLLMVTPRLANLRVLLFPGKDRPAMTALSTWLLRRRVRSALRILGAQPHATIVQPPQRPLLAGLHDQRRVYLVTDDYIAMAAMNGFPAAHMSRGEARMALDADLIVVISAVLADKFRAMGYESLLVPNGCDEALFGTTDTAPPANDVTLSRPIIGFVGYLSNRIDFTLLEAVARRGHSVLLVGARSEAFDSTRAVALLARPNVQWVGGKQYDALPSYLRVTDVALVPYLDDANNRASFPLKILEYLAAGRRVVATDLPAVRWLGTDLIRIAPNDPEGFADVVDAALAEPDDDLARQRRRAFAAGHSWARRTDLLTAALDLPFPRPAAG
jgi:teichuronic acid biosynthesis glycosyltransferase TuaH